MDLPTPVPGLVIRYAFLWRREALKEQEEGRKDRPCAIVLAAPVVGDAMRVFVLPVTHTSPRDPTGGIEMPPRVKAQLQLDADRSWIVVEEFNEFLWPGYDLRSVPGRRPAGAVYGALPPRFFNKVRDAFLQLAREKRVRRTVRD